MSRQKSFENQLRTAGADPSTAAETARILTKDSEYDRSSQEQSTVQTAHRQISK